MQPSTTIRSDHFGPAATDLGGMETVLRTYSEAPFERVSIRVIPSTGQASAAVRLRLFLRAVRKLARWRSRDIVHLHLSQRGSFLREGLLALLAPSRNAVVATIHGSSFVETSSSRRWRSIYRLVLRRLDAVAVLNGSALAVVRELAPGVSASVLPNPGPVTSAMLDDAGSRSVGHGPTVLFGGRIGYRKGIDLLIPAWREVLEAHPRAVLQLSGPIDDDLPEQLRVEVETYHVGALSGQDVIRLLGQADIAVLPSRAEGQPMFLIEALGCGVPLIVTDVGGMPDLAASCGIVVPAGDQIALASALRELLANSTKRATLAKNALKKYRSHFSQAAHEELLVQLYRDAMHRATDRARN